MTMQRHYAVIFLLAAAASAASAAPQTLGDGAGDADGRAIEGSPLQNLAARLNALKNEFPLNTLCDGEAPLSCTCDRRDEPLEGPFTLDNLEEIVKECLPNICTCADGSERKTLTRLRPLLDLKGICSGKLPESCLCADGEERFAMDAEQPLPVLLAGIMKECKPRGCRCDEDGEDIPFTTFGCSAGGPPNCLKEGEKGKLLCDGEVLSIKKLARARLSGECVCDDGVVPVCDNTGNIPKCWDGSDPDPDLGALNQDHIKKCKKPEEEE